jgi:hypothetical protein
VLVPVILIVCGRPAAGALLVAAALLILGGAVLLLLRTARAAGEPPRPRPGPVAPSGPVPGARSEGSPAHSPRSRRRRR